MEELDLEIQRVELREEQRLINIARKEGYFRVRFRNDEIATMFRNAIHIDALPAIDFAGASTTRATSTLEILARKRARLEHGNRRGETRRKVLLGAFLTAQCRQSPAFHETCAADIRSWIAEAPDPATVGRNTAALAEWLRHPGTAIEDPGTRDPEDAHRAHNHRMILLGAWVMDRRDAIPELAERVGSHLRGFVDSDEKTAELNRKILGEWLD